MRNAAPVVPGLRRACLPSSIVGFFHGAFHTHLYPDGPAPYFTWHAFGDKAKLVEQFWAIKAAASAALVDAGGTITHHHALGRDHRTWYDRERPDLFADALKAVKQTLDPHHVLNPGILID